MLWSVHFPMVAAIRWNCLALYYELHLNTRVAKKLPTWPMPLQSGTKLGNRNSCNNPEQSLRKSKSAEDFASKLWDMVTDDLMISARFGNAIYNYIHICYLISRNTPPRRMPVSLAELFSCMVCRANGSVSATVRTVIAHKCKRCKRYRTMLNKCSKGNQTLLRPNPNQEGCIPNTTHLNPFNIIQDTFTIILHQSSSYHIIQYPTSSIHFMSQFWDSFPMHRLAGAELIPAPVQKLPIWPFVSAERCSEHLTDVVQFCANYIYVCLYIYIYIYINITQYM